MKKFFTSRWGIVSIGVFVVLVLLIFNALSFFDSSRSALSSVFGPLQQISTSIGQRAENFSAFFASRKRLVEEVNRLEELSTRLSKENSELFQQLENLQALREEMDFISEKGYDAIPAKVIGRNVFPAPPSLLVNRGAGADIRPGAAVMTDTGVVVGRVADTTATTSLVSLITDPQSEFAVKVQNESLSNGILLGSHGSGLQLTRIPYDHALAVGQRVVTAGTEEAIPPDLYIGMIESTQYRKGELFQSAVVAPALDLSNVTVVAVIR